MKKAIIGTLIASCIVFANNNTTKASLLDTDISNLFAPASWLAQNQ